MVNKKNFDLNTRKFAYQIGDMDASLPLPLARHFYKRYSSLNSNATLIELPRTGHTATGTCSITIQTIVSFSFFFI